MDFCLILVLCPINIKKKYSKETEIERKIPYNSQLCAGGVPWRIRLIQLIQANSLENRNFLVCGAFSHPTFRTHSLSLCPLALCLSFALSCSPFHPRPLARLLSLNRFRYSLFITPPNYRSYSVWKLCLLPSIAFIPHFCAVSFVYLCISGNCIAQIISFIECVICGVLSPLFYSIFLVRIAIFFEKKLCVASITTRSSSPSTQYRSHTMYNI